MARADHFKVDNIIINCESAMNTMNADYFVWSKWAYEMSERTTNKQKKNQPIVTNGDASSGNDVSRAEGENKNHIRYSIRCWLIFHARYMVLGVQTSVATTTWPATKRTKAKHAGHKNELKNCVRVPDLVLAVLIQHQLSSTTPAKGKPFMNKLIFAE